MSENRTVPAWSAPYRIVMALRLLRARKINFISIIGVTLGVASIIVVLSIMDGFQRELRAMIRGTLSDLIVEIDPASGAKYGDMKRALEAVDGVEAVTLQRHTFGAIPIETKDSDGSRSNYMPVRIIGLLTEDEARVSSVIDYMRAPDGQPADPFEVESENFLPESMPRVVVSGWIARRLHVKVGDLFPLLSFEEVERDGRPTYQTRDRDVVVSSIYSSGNSEFDRLHIYVDLKGSGAVFFDNSEGIINELRLKLTDYRLAQEAREDVARALDAFDPGFGLWPERHIETWEDRQHNLLLAVNNEKFILAFVLFFIVLVACFTIFATLTMTVVEKTREIGVLSALGATPGGILSIFMINGTAVGLIGALLGYVLGLIVASNVNPIREFLKRWTGWDIFPPDIYLFDEIPTYIDHKAALYFAMAAAGSALFFAIIPAIRAARLRPVQALRYE